MKLWDKVTESTQPLDKKKSVVHDTPPKKNNQKGVIKPEKVFPKIKTLSQSANEPFQKKVILENSQKVKMDMKAFTKLKKR